MPPRFVLYIALPALTLGYTGLGYAGICDDSGQHCTQPCPSEVACGGDGDCPTGMMCGPGGLPGLCRCLFSNGEYRWSCTFDRLGMCVPPRQWTGIPEYVIIDLGTLGGWTAAAQGINDCGQVVGEADTRTGIRHAFLWDAGQMSDLGTLPGLPLSAAIDISNGGQIVGISGEGGAGDPFRSFLWEDGQMSDLGDLGGPETTVIATNDAAQAVGTSSVSLTRKHPFLWQAGKMTDLHEVLGDDAGVYGIGEEGELVGTRRTGAVDGWVTTHAARWINGELTDLGSLGGFIAGATALNRSGAVVGSSQRAPGPAEPFHAFLWSTGTMLDLGLIGGFSSSKAKDINDSGQVIGSPSFLYDAKRGTRRLEHIIPPGRWAVLEPYAMNDLGQIVGWGEFWGVPRAFLMTPLSGDFDSDNDTDLADFAGLRACMAGPRVLVETSCRTFDIDRNGAIDLVDVQAFQWVFGAP